MKWQNRRKVFYPGRCAALGLVVFALTVVMLFPFTLVGNQKNKPKQARVSHLFSTARQTFDTGMSKEGQEKRQLMLKSAALFLEIVDDHSVRNGYLFYNAGNAFFEADELGKAILYYRKAERLIPGYSELRYNLHLARQQADQSLDRANWWDDVLKGVFFWHYMLDYSLKKTLFVGVFACVWICLGVMIFRRHVLINIVIIMLIVANIALGGSFLMTAFQTDILRQGVVLSKTAIARKGPGLAYEKLYDTPIPQGVEFRLLEQTEEWLRIKLPDGNMAWIDTHDAGKI